MHHGGNATPLVLLVYFDHDCIIPSMVKYKTSLGLHVSLYSPSWLALPALILIMEHYEQHLSWDLRPKGPW